MNQKRSMKCEETLQCTQNSSIFTLFYSRHVLVESVTQIKLRFSLKIDT